jgi:protein-S-isoprenylcysteine O-methyltransferase Ste14
VTSRAVIPFLFRAVAVAGLLAAIVPWMLYARSPPFPGLLPATVAFFVVVVERLWGAFGRMPEKAAVEPERDWTAVAVGLAFVCELYAILAEVHVRRHGFGAPLTTGLGAILYASGVALRTWALRTLGAAWAIHLDRNDAPGGTLIRTGPYRLVRHPIYAGAMIDALGVALFFGSTWGFACALLLFWPAEIARARFEEGFMRVRFGEAYALYEREAGGFFPTAL